MFETPPPVIENYIPEPVEPYLVESNKGTVGKGKTNSPLFSEVYPKHLELMSRNKRREQTIGETEQTYLDVIELIGDKPIGEYSNLDGRTFRTSIISLPKNRKKMKQYRNKTLHELLEIDVPEEDRLSVDTQTTISSSGEVLIQMLLLPRPV